MYLEIAKETVLEAADIVMSYFGKEKFIKMKSEIDPVTKADVETEEFIRKKLSKLYPDHGFIVEEGQDLDGKYQWIIDPIDGTRNFAHDHPFFCISLALYKGKEPIVGVVYAPYLKEMFWAETGKGAFLNGKEIKVSSTDTIRRSLVATGFPYTRVTSNIDNLNYFNKVAKEAAGLRRCGAAALDMCYIACGRYDAYWEITLKAVDSAAGMLIVREAGGRVSDIVGNPDTFNEVVATNGVVHDELLEMLRGAQ